VYPMDVFKQGPGRTVGAEGKGGGEQLSLAGKGVGDPQFGRLDRRPGTLYTLWPR
jgi:hypothetical protein